MTPGQGAVIVLAVAYFVVVIWGLLHPRQVSLLLHARAKH